MVGETINAYIIVSHLGSGGMADVYLAEDERTGERVALKTLPRVYRGNPRLIARFEREISNLRRLEHPGIIKILDEGQYDGRPYYVMEYVDGPTLRDVLRNNGPLPPERVVEVAIDICAALEYAHGMGIVHRDIKAANIMIGSRDEVKVADFGIAQAMDRTRLTSTGAKGIGTPQYMSPEQIRGERVDGRSDLYSLGILMFELLTGNVPFRGQMPIEIAVRQMENIPPAPSSLVASIPDWLNEVVLHLLEKRPESRFRDAGDLMQTLLAEGDIPFHDAVPTTETRASIKYVAFDRLRPILPVLLILLSLAGLCIGGYMVQRRPESEGKEHADRWKEQAHRAGFQVEGLGPFGKAKAESSYFEAQNLEKLGEEEYRKAAFLAAAKHYEEAFSLYKRSMQEIMQAKKNISAAQESAHVATPARVQPKEHADDREVPEHTSKALEKIVVSSDFDKEADPAWALAGAATIRESRIVLTPASLNQAGSVFYAHPVPDCSRFEVSFDFEMVGDADGITFAWVPGPGILGRPGTFLGYEGLQGYAVEFDIYQNAYDPERSHIALIRNDVSHHIAISTDFPELANSGGFRCSIVLTNSLLTVSLSNAQAGLLEERVVLSHTIQDYEPFDAFLGFTGATGGLSALQLIDNVELSASFDRTVNGKELLHHFKDNKDVRDIDSLIAVLNDDDQSFHRAWNHIRDEHAVEPLIAALKDGNGRVRSGAAWALGNIGDKRAVEPLIAALKDYDGKVRSNAGWALGRIGDVRAVEPLIALLKDNDCTAKRNAAYALGEIGDPLAVEPLIAALRDNCPRASAAWALGNIGDKRAVVPLIAVLQDNDWTAKRNAAHALGQIGDPLAVEPLIAALGKEYSAARNRMTWALISIGEPAVHELIAAMKEDEGIRRDAERILAAIDPDWRNKAGAAAEHAP